MFAPLKACVTVKGLPVWKCRDAIDLPVAEDMRSNTASQEGLPFSERKLVHIAEYEAVTDVLTSQTFLGLPVVGILEAAATVGFSHEGAARVIDGFAPRVCRPGT